MFGGVRACIKGQTMQHLVNTKLTSYTCKVRNGMWWKNKTDIFGVVHHWNRPTEILQQHPCMVKTDHKQRETCNLTPPLCGIGTILKAKASYVRVCFLVSYLDTFKGCILVLLNSALPSTLKCDTLQCCLRQGIVYLLGFFYW